jgi:hypothetical protein
MMMVQIAHFACVFLAFVVTAIVFGRAAIFVRSLRPATGPLPICKICGYNLQHLGQDARCPECGTSIRESLTQNVRRCAWPTAFVRALGSPAAFVCRVVSGRDLSRARRFALLCYLLAGAALSLLIVYFESPRLGLRLGGWDLIVPASFVLGAVAVIGYLGHRVIAALVFIAWNTRGHRTPPDAFAHAMYYEAVLVPLLALLVYAAAYSSEIYARMNNFWPTSTGTNPFDSIPAPVWILIFAGIILFPPLMRYRRIRDRLRFDASM